MRKAIVIGAGFGGIAAAVRLKKKGYEVEIVDRCNNLGGRAQFFNKEGFKYDAGPTIITAPFLFKELFALHNKNLEDYVSLKPLDIWYRFIYNDGTHFDYEKSLKNTISNIKNICKEDANNYKILLDKSKKIYDVAFKELANKPFHNLSFMIKQIPTLLKFKSYESVYKFTSKHLKNEKLRRAFSIQPLLVGGNPFDTTCIYSLIHFLEREHGVYFAMGGTGKLVNAFTNLIEEIGVKVSLDTTIEKFSFNKNKISAAYDQKGVKREADIYVSNTDPIYLYKYLIKNKNNMIFNLKQNRIRHSMGLFVLFFGTKKKYNKVKHHTILFGEENFELLNKIFHKYELPTDISIYLHRPTATDNTFAPQGCDSFYALVPVPNLIAKNISWDTQAQSFRKLIIEVLERRLMPGLKNEIKHCFHMSPVDFKERYLSDAGAGFSLAPFFTQSAWFRFHNKSEIIKNLYLVGAGTHPGAGLPGVLSSAKTLESLL